MAIITEVQLQDGSVHQLGGSSGGNTYTLTKNGDTITLTGSGGDTSSVTDSDTKYTISINGQTLTLTPSTGSPQSVTLPDDDTTYTISINGHVLTLTPSNGTPQTINLPDEDTTYSLSITGDVLTLESSDGNDVSVTLPNDDTTYALSKSGSTITLTGSDGTTTTVTDSNTTYTFALSGNTLTITPSDGSAQTITLPDDDTTYTLSISGGTLTLTGSDGSTDSVSVQEPLVSGTNIKTINGNSILGSGDITIQDDDTTYTLSISGNTLTLTGSDGSTSTATITDDDTTYTISVSGDTLTLTGSDGSTDSVTLPDNNTTYTFSVSGHTLTITPSSGSAQTVTLPDDNTTYTLSISGNVLSLTPSSGTAQTVTLPIPSPSSTTPKMDGTASVGSETNYARGDHIHPSDTSKQDTLVSGTNIKTINGTSLLGSGDLTIQGGSDEYKAFYGTCSTAAATATKDVTLSNTTGWTLLPGTIVGVRFTNTNTASSVKLNVNGTGAKSIYYNASIYTGTDSNITGYANRTLFYMYDGTNWVWIQSSQYWGNTYDRTVLTNSGYKAGSSAIVAGNIITANTSGLYQHLKSGAQFDITMPILYASSAAAASATNNGGYITIPFTITTTQSITLTAYKPIYIKGTLAGKLFTPVSTTPLTQTEPTSADGYEYLLLGYATTTTVAYLLPEHPIYAYTGGAFTRIGGKAITNITRSGTTFTATREDNSTFTFTQQDTDNDHRRGFYGTCSTAAATAAKVITLANTSGWELIAGTIIMVKFTYTNTASNPTFNVNSSGAKNVWYNTALITTSNLNRAGYATRPQLYMYDGTQWVWIGMSAEDNTWNANAINTAGYVSAPTSSNPLAVWGTDSSGNPTWRQRTLYSATSSNAISSTNIDSRTNGASVTLPAGHSYLIVAQWIFNTRTTSGTTNSQVCIHNGSAIVASQRIFASASNYNVLQCMYITNLLSSDVTYTVQGSSSRAYTNATDNWIRAIALN